MTPEFFIDLATQTLRTALFLAAPPLVVSLLVGVVISIFQSVMQMQEQTLVMVPKMIAILLIILFSLPWMLQIILEFTSQLFIHMPEYVR